MLTLPLNYVHRCGFIDACVSVCPCPRGGQDRLTALRPAALHDLWVNREQSLVWAIKHLCSLISFLPFVFHWLKHKPMNSSDLITAFCSCLFYFLFLIFTFHQSVTTSVRTPLLLRKKKKVNEQECPQGMDIMLLSGCPQIIKGKILKVQ